jgi:hypothetical protein
MRAVNAGLRRPLIPRVSIRWTVGDVSLEGFQALRLSTWGAHRIFGDAARYVVCVNTVGLETARERTGDVPAEVEWLDVTGAVPDWVRRAFGRGMGEGVAWKLAPVRLFPDAFEIALDNDCILWRMPAAMDEWIRSGRGHLLAEDVRPCFGRFADACGPAPRNTGIRGVAPGFDLERALQRVVPESGGPLSSELDEQGLQVAALSDGDLKVVSTRQVSICSPFPPHARDLGQCGAHFVGLNARHVPWSYEGRPGHEVIRAHWAQRRADVAARVESLKTSGTG